MTKSTMYKHSDGWGLNARILRLHLDDYEAGLARDAKAGTNHTEYLERIVRDEISQDDSLVWC
jgi:hypothetical protein